MLLIKIYLLNINQKTPLHIACINGKFDFVNYLISKNVEINCIDIYFLFFFNLKKLHYTIL